MGRSIPYCTNKHCLSLTVNGFWRIGWLFGSRNKGLAWLSIRVRKGTGFHFILNENDTEIDSNGNSQVARHVIGTYHMYLVECSRDARGLSNENAESKAFKLIYMVAQLLNPLTFNKKSHNVHPPFYQP